MSLVEPVPLHLGFLGEGHDAVCPDSNVQRSFFADSEHGFEDCLADRVWLLPDLRERWDGHCDAPGWKPRSTWKACWMVSTSMRELFATLAVMEVRVPAGMRMRL